MPTLIQALDWATLAVSAAGSLYTVAAALAVGWLIGRRPGIAHAFPPVTILKPLHGDEPGLRQCLESFCRQSYPAPVQIVFGVRDPFDAAIPIVRELIKLHPGLEIELVIDPRIWGSNLKISNLINMETRARHELLVLADSDVSVAPDYLRQLAGALSDPAVGFATCAYIGAPTGNFWSRLSGMAINHHFLPSVALGLRMKWAKPCFGPTIAFNRDVFDRIGGFTRFIDVLADDFEIGRAILGLGYTFAVPPMLIRHGCPERHGRSLFRHELRWAYTIRLVAPASYAGSVICHPLPFALIACLLQPGAAAWAMVALAVVTRLFVVVEVGRLAGGDAGIWWLSPVRDLLSASVHVCGYFVRTVHWQGRRFAIRSVGMLTPLGQAAAGAQPRLPDAIAIRNAELPLAPARRAPESSPA